jgi:hypothetical protein
MASPALDDDDKPLDPAVERVRARLVRFMAINLGLLFLALMAVAVAIVYKSTTPSGEAAPAMAASGDPRAGEIALPEGAEIVSQALDGGRLSLHLRHADGTQSILVYDLDAAATVGRYAIGR